MKLSTTLITTIAAMMIASTAWPRNAEIALATSSIKTRGLVQKRRN